MNELFLGLQFKTELRMRLTGKQIPTYKSSNAKQILNKAEFFHTK
jgi:hypothetical protein